MMYGKMYDDVAGPRCLGANRTAVRDHYFCANRIFFAHFTTVKKNYGKLNGTAERDTLAVMTMFARIWIIYPGG